MNNDNETRIIIKEEFNKLLKKVSINFLPTIFASKFKVNKEPLKKQTKEWTMKKRRIII